MWRCDSCGESIARPKDGWIEWISDDVQGPCHGLRLVHHASASPRTSLTKCQYDQAKVFATNGAIVQDISLERGLGPDGLMHLLSLLEENFSPPEVTRLIMRLHVPNYEAALPNMKAAVSEGVIEPNLPSGYFWQQQLLSIVEWAGIHDD